jgi:hypothetical protein
LVRRLLAGNALVPHRDGTAIKDAAVIKIMAVEDSELVLVDTP